MKNRTILFIFVVDFLVLIPLIHGQRIIDLNQVEGDVHILGVETGDGLGTDITTGDVNGDGIRDILFATWKWIPNGPSTYYVFFGETHPVPNKVIDLETDTPDLVLLTPTCHDPKGSNVACGDINGDKIDDIILGEAYFQSTLDGMVWAILGRCDFTSGQVIDLSLETPYIEITGFENSRTGGSIACGDINKDGYDDIFMGARKGQQWGGVGSVYVVFGSPSFPPGHTVDLEYEYDMGLGWEDDVSYLGRCVCSADINGDEIDDLVASADADALWPMMGNGSINVIYGSPDHYPGKVIRVDQSDLRIWGEKSGEALGSSVACGDLNGDGVDDIVAGARYYNATAGGGGRISVIYGGSYPPKHQITLSSIPEDITILPVASGTNADYGLGEEVSCGDLNGDGLDDICLLVSHSLIDGHWGGKIYIVYGSSDFPAEHVIDFTVDTPDWMVKGKYDDEIFSNGSITVADITGDGFADMCAGARAELVHGDTASGALHVFYGLGKAPYGEGLPGTGGISPVLTSQAAEEPIIGTSLGLEVSDGLGGAFGMLFISLEPGKVFFMGGFMYLNPFQILLQIPFVLTNPGGNAGAGTLQLAGSIPMDPYLVVNPLYMQAFIADPAANYGVSMTNALQVTFGNVGE